MNLHELATLEIDVLTALGRGGLLRGIPFSVCEALVAQDLIDRNLAGAWHLTSKGRVALRMHRRRVSQ